MTITEMKKSLESLQIRVEQAEGRISKLDDRSIVTIQCEEQRNEQSLRHLWKTIKPINIDILRVLEERIERSRTNI